MADLAALSTPAGFEQLVAHMMLADNESRKQAEAVFEKVKEHPDACAGSLLTVMRSSANIEHRSFAAITLRRVLTRDDPTLWSKCSDNVKAGIKHELLLALNEEQDKTVLRKAWDTVAELGAELADEQLPGGTQWPELVPTMFSFVQSGVPVKMETGLSVLASLAHCMVTALQPQLGPLTAALGSCLSHADREVQLAALKATSNFIQALDEPAEREKLSPLIQPMLACLASSLNAGDEASAQEALEMFIEVAEAHPRFLRRQLVEVVGAALNITRAQQLEAATRSLAAEFLVTLCEARDKAPGMMRKLPTFAASLFEVLMLFLLDVEDDPLWHQAEDEEHEDEGSGELYGFAQECLDRIAISLGGNAIVPTAGNLLPAWLQDADWRKRHAALICLAQIAEGCKKVMLTQVVALVDMCVKGLADPMPKVRWAACQALGQMCTDLGPDIQDKCHALILPALMGAMDDFQHPRVQAHASAAVVNFSECAEQELLPPYLDTLISKLLVLLQNGKRLVQEGALTALASVADCSQLLFVKYYEVVMPLLLGILVNATDKSQRLLRGKALECVSLVGMAVGRDRFRADAASVLAWLQSLSNGPAMDADDPTLGYMLQAGARLCKCLGQEFVPYLPVVMPPLLKSAAMEADIKVTDAEEDGAEEEEDEDPDVERIQMGDKMVSIRTSSLEEKATACNMLCCYADELKDGFFPYVKPVADIMVPLLKFWFHEDVRRAAVQTLPELVRALVLCVEKGSYGVDNSLVKQLLDYIWPAMMEALGKEPETDIQATSMDSISEIVELVEPSMLSQEQVSAAFQRFTRILKASEERRTERLKRQSTEDFDEEELEALEQENEAEEELFDQVGSAIGAFLKKFGDAVLPFVESLMVQMGPLLDKSRPAEDRRIAICVVDDLLEHSPAGRAKYFQQVLPVLMEATTDEHADLRQCAVYGLGILAAKAPEAFRPFVPEALQRILHVIGAPNAKEEDNQLATDNALSALGKILEFHSDAIDSGAVTQAWLGGLPLLGDVVEAAVQHDLLARLLEARDPRLLGANGASLPRVLGVLVTILGHGTRLVSGDVGKRLALQLHSLQPSVPQDALQTSLSALSDKQRANFNTFMAGNVPDGKDD
ncbi:armadillo-type protein [Haematococcus lacustris]